MKDNIGFDWNRNGKTDAFDHFMNIKAASSSLTAKQTKQELHSENASGIEMGGKQIYDATKDSNGIVILKSLLVVGLCIAGIFLPVAADMEGLAVALCPLAAVGLSVLILKNT